ncbi:MAG: DUF6261 family protein [Prevotellaceae bacterium]|jgi:hypothetical protein|nr:DUF6261 family protein [Prevotellaceae bacterium]
MKRFISLRVDALKLDNLAGLCDETIVAAIPQAPALGTLGNTRLNSLDAANKTLKSLLNQQHASALTPKIKEADKQRDADFAEIKRTATTAAKSSTPDIAAAGATLLELLKPFWNIGHEPLASQTTQINILMERYNGNPAAGAAAATLGLTDIVNRLFAGNAALYLLYNERLEAMAEAEGPSATSVKQTVVAAYNSFCDVMEQTLDALPSDPLQLLFNEMNELRRKYIHHLPKDLGAGDHTVIEPIDTQPYSGRPITVVPKVHYREEGKPTENLSLGKDFSITYKNNTNVGMAELTIHGKGAYKGQKTVTFNIAR